MTQAPSYDARLNERDWSSPDLDVHMFSQTYRAFAGSYEKLDELWIFLCTQGGGRLVRKSAAQDLDGLFVPGTVGIGSPEDGGEGFGPNLELVGLGIEPQRLARLLEELPPGCFDLAAIASTFHRNALLAGVVQEMWACTSLHAHASAFIDHGLAIVMHLLVRSLGVVERPTEDYRLSKREVKMVKDFVEANLAKDLSVESLANIVGLSPNHFSRRFRTTTGLAPYQFLTQRRLDRAAEYLLATRLPVTQVGMMVGYPNPSHLAAAFRRYKGVSPLTWRRSRQEGH